jgi:CheY-like chemotaxis protein/nitrogen-specific signal transduction histidine kinase
MTDVMPVDGEDTGSAELGNAAEAKLRKVRVAEPETLDALSRMSGNVAHDFSNLFATILLNLGLIERRIDDPAIGKFLDGARQAAEIGGAITERLIVAAARQPLALEPTDVAELLSGLRDLLGQMMGPAVRIEVVLDDGLWPFHVDAAAIGRSLLHLAENARNAMPDGGCLTIAAANRHLVKNEGELAPGDYVRISIADTGLGMTDAVLARACEPFFTTKNGGGGGAGLGLSMAQGIVRQHGGALRISSRLGVGTTVTMHLPLPAANGKATHRLEPGHDGRPRHAAGTILVVDDDPNLRTAAIDALDTLGFKTVQARSGEAALDILRSGRSLALVLADYRMAGMNGIELAGHVRSLRPNLRVILMTGAADSSLDLVKADANVVVLRKPFRLSDIAAQIGRGGDGLDGHPAK